MPSSDPNYDCIAVTRSDAQTYTAPDGFTIDGVADVFRPEQVNGTTNVSLSPDRRSIIVSGDVTAGACYLNNAGTSANASSSARSIIFGILTGGVSVAVEAAQNRLGRSLPEQINGASGHVRRQVLLRLKSLQPTRVVSHKPLLVVTSRGLCCCAQKGGYTPRIVSIAACERQLASIPWQDIPKHARAGAPAPAPSVEAGMPALLNARQANVLAEVVADMTKRVAINLSSPGTMPGHDTSFLLARLSAVTLASADSRRMLSQSAASANLLTNEQAAAVGALIGKAGKDVTRFDLLTVPDKDLGAVVTTERMTPIRLAALGLGTVPPPPNQ